MSMASTQLLAAAAAGATMVALAAAACTTPAGPAEPTRRTAAWERVPLPGGAAAVTLASAGEEVVVGAFAAGRPHPRLFAGTVPGSLRSIPIAPHSPYAFEARWLAIAARDGTVAAVGGARGGAHANVRWTVWTGTTTQVTEHEQPFEVFGGWNAGDLAGVAFAGTTPVVLGSWASERTGLDVATWLPTGDRWRRQPSTGTGLGSTAAELLSARSVTSTGAGLAASGSVTRLDPGAISIRPALWLAPSARGPWTRVDLPATATPAEAHAAACQGGTCLVAGQAGGRLVLWEVHGTTATRVAGVPAAEVPEHGYALAPVGTATVDAVVLPDGSADDSAQNTSSGTRVLVRDGGRWTSVDGPAGTAQSAVAQGRVLWVVTTDPAGSGTLWRARL